MPAVIVYFLLYSIAIKIMPSTSFYLCICRIYSVFLLILIQTSTRLNSKAPFILHSHKNHALCPLLSPYPPNLPPAFKSTQSPYPVKVQSSFKPKISIKFHLHTPYFAAFHPRQSSHSTAYTKILQLIQTFFFQSPWRESNPRPHPYQGCALPLSHMGCTSRAGDGSRTRNPQLGRLVL